MSGLPLECCALWLCYSDQEVMKSICFVYIPALHCYITCIIGFSLFFCFVFFVCMMLSWSIPGTECSSFEIDQAAQSLLLIFKQRSRITLPSDAQIRLSGIMMISVILYWNRGKKVLTASLALLRYTRIVSMWGDSGHVNLPFTQLSFINWSSV